MLFALGMFKQFTSREQYDVLDPWHTWLVSETRLFQPQNFSKMTGL